MPVGVPQAKVSTADRAGLNTECLRADCDCAVINCRRPVLNRSFAELTGQIQFEHLLNGRVTSQITI